MKYVSLHHHSTFSFMDGFGLPSEHVARTADLGMSALALTEHGNMSSAASLEKAAVKAGIKPIFGCELYMAPEKTRQKFHLTVLASDGEGLANLQKLVSLAYSEGFYQWPTVSNEMLFQNNAGLIVISGCSDSQLNCTLLGGKSLGDKRERISSENLLEAKNLIYNFKEVFGDRYYLEIQQFPELQRTSTLNPALIELAYLTKTNFVATSDVHYPYLNDNEMQKILHAAGRGTGSVAAQEQTWEYDIRLTLPTSDELIHDRLMNAGLNDFDAWSAIECSAGIASRCNVILPKSTRLRFPLKGGRSGLEELWSWLRTGWRYRKIGNNKSYVKRLMYEMDVIRQKDFADYFLMVSDAIRFAKNSEIPVSTRGSCTSSLVCYLLRITEIDPMRYPLMVIERFLDLSRSDLPDIDIDLDDVRRGEVIKYFEDKYGREHVGSIGNFIRYRGRNSLDDVARVYSLPRWQIERIKDVLIERPDGDARISNSIEDTFTLFKQAAVVRDEYPELDYAMRLEGNYRGMNVHAAGLVVSNKPITDICATYTREIDGVRRTIIAYDKKDALYMGMLKVDLLGLKNIGMISIALRLIGMKLEDLYSLEFNDEKVFDAFGKNDVLGIFQFDGRTQRIVCSDVVPSRFMDLADINALSRPGALYGGITQAYIKAKRVGKWKKIHSVMDKITSKTYGQIIYQEQIFQICRELGGFTAEKTSEVRNVIQLKLGGASFNKLFEEFASGAAKRGVSREQSRSIWTSIAGSSNYSFNVAHAISYASLSYYQMWLKVHHPLAFYIASLQKMTDDKKTREFKLPRLLADARRRGLSVLPPHLNKSGLNWVSENSGLRAGLTQIPGVGEKMAQTIIENRSQEGNFRTWGNLQRVDRVGAKTVEKIHEFCTAEDPFNLDLASKKLNLVRRKIASSALPSPTHTGGELIKIQNGEGGVYVVWLGIVRQILFGNELEKIRKQTGQNEEEILKEIDRPDLLDSCLLRCYDDGPEDINIRINRFRYLKFKEVITGIEVGSDMILVVGKFRSGFGVNINPYEIYVLEL